MDSSCSVQNWMVMMRLGKRQSLAVAGKTSYVSLTCPFADAAFLRNLRVASREINPARKIAGPQMNIAPRASTGNQCSAPLRGKAVRLPTRTGTPRARSEREFFHSFMRGLRFFRQRGSTGCARRFVRSRRRGSVAHPGTGRWHRG